jgi:hypothetical protein
MRRVAIGSRAWVSVKILYSQHQATCFASHLVCLIKNGTRAQAGLLSLTVQLHASSCRINGQCVHRAAANAP